MGSFKLKICLGRVLSRFLSLAVGKAHVQFDTLLIVSTMGGRLGQRGLLFSLIHLLRCPIGEKGREEARDTPNEHAIIIDCRQIN